MTCFFACETFSFFINLFHSLMVSCQLTGLVKLMVRVVVVLVVVFLAKNVIRPKLVAMRFSLYCLEAAIKRKIFFSFW